MIEFRSRIGGVPCIIKATIEAGCPATIDDPGDPGDFYFDVLTPDGDPDPELAEHVDSYIELRLYEEALSACGEINTDRAVFYRS